MGNCLAGLCRRYCCYCGCREDEETAEELHRRGAEAWTQYNAEENKDSENRPGYLATVVTFYTRALDLAGSGHHLLRKTILVDLIFALLENDNLDVAHIEEYFTEVRTIRPLNSHTQQCHFIALKLGEYYEDRWKTSSNEEDFERCVVNYTHAAHSGSSAEDKVEWFLVVADLHINRKESSHYERALKSFREARGAVPKTTDWDTQRYQIARGMCTTHMALSSGGKDKTHLESAIAECGSALDLRAPQEDRRQLLVDYVRCVWALLDNFEGTPSAAVLKKAVTHGREALDWLSSTGDNDGTKHTVIVLLANILSYPSEILRKKDLDEALLLYERAEVVAPMDGDLLRKMADAVWLQSKRTNDFEGLQKAIDLFVRAYDEAAQNLRANIANNIATIYLERAKVTNVFDLKLAREYYLRAEQESSEQDDQIYFAVKVKEIEDAVRELEGVGASQVGARRRLSGERRQTVTRKATID
ncbi:hypothetical protein DFP72DRAFT_934981 [Ephemerocybe angulata]|uniref:Uncharacterized protein n=1 Tax=Ephemerocybe angulata TaxID=980116 RepID=A0A8H6HA41_9AGAR|nr:hypothetical protein DFP72DRAFT_934981 [Tulosesus angulatus]